MGEEIRSIVKEECKRIGVENTPLIMSIIHVESNGVAKSARYEKQYTYYWKDKEFARIQNISLETERAFQKTSWGPMQIMGGTARWLGYTSWLPDLCDLRIGVIWGLQYFKKVCDKQLYINDKIAIYNAGSIRKTAEGKYVNQAYVDKVLAQLDEEVKKEFKYLS